MAGFLALVIHAIATGNRHQLPPVEYLTLLTCIITSGVIVWAVRRTRWPLTDYLALVTPLKLHIAVAIIGAIGIGLGEATLLSWLGGGEANDEAVLAGYFAARRAGLLPLYWLNTVALAPLTEEIVFRGFLLPSWARTLGWPVAIAGTSILFALMHFQYDWRGMLAVGLLGVFSAWLRLRSGSLVPSFVAHAGGNLLATIGLVLSLA
jgi:membrane protease YdiL (CAAX protease family)